MILTLLSHEVWTRKSILNGIANSLAVQVKLYDECEKLLECRLLKNDETVTSGETLIFKGYLVDVGDPEGGIKPESDLNVDRKLRNHSRFRTPSGLNSLIVSLQVYILLKT